MPKHQLSLDIPDVLTESVFRVVDTSLYQSNLPENCAKLEITPPGFQLPYTFTDLSPGFSVNLSACQIGMQIYNCGVQFGNLPDGVYIVRYSLSPNDVLYVEYNHLRISHALNLINNLLCCLDMADCEPAAPLKEKIQRLKLLEMMLKGAKSKVEFCHNPKHGMAMYNYVVSQLKKLSCGCGCGDC